MLYNNLSSYLKMKYGGKVSKICIDGGFGCPNRDGTCGVGGCIYCGERGAGEHIDPSVSIREQVEAVLGRDKRSDHFIAYFQNFTNTYASVDVLKERYDSALISDRIVALAIGTRPDCITEEIAELIASYRDRVDVWVELGLQTSSEETAEYIRRCYRNEVYEEAVRRLKELDVPVITHVILGLPGETEDDMKATVRYAVDCGTWGLKLQLLHVLEGTDLGEQYKAQKAGSPLPGARPVRVMSLEEYTDLLCALLPLIPNDVVIHRLTGDGPKRILLAPLWSGDKKRVLNTIGKAIRELPEP